MYASIIIITVEFAECEVSNSADPCVNVEEILTHYYLFFKLPLAARG